MVLAQQPDSKLAWPLTPKPFAPPVLTEIDRMLPLNCPMVVSEQGASGDGAGPIGLSSGNAAQLSLQPAGRRRTLSAKHARPKPPVRKFKAATIPNPGRVGIWSVPGLSTPSRNAVESRRSAGESRSIAVTVPSEFALYPRSQPASPEAPKSETEPSAPRGPVLTTSLPSGYGASLRKTQPTTGHSTSFGNGRGRITVHRSAVRRDAPSSPRRCGVAPRAGGG